MKYLRQTAFAEVYSCWPPPIFLLAVSLIQLAIFCIHVHHLNQNNILNSLRSNHLAPLCSMLIFNPKRRSEAWRYLSYAFVHDSVGHISGNLIMQLFVGLPLEMSHGSLRTSVVYTAGVVAGSLATSSFEPYMYLCGASGGVYSLIAAHLATQILNWKEDGMIIRRRLRDGSLHACSSDLYRLLRLLSVVIYAVVDVSVAIYSHTTAVTPETVGYLAHLAGAGAGLAVGITVLKNRKKEIWERFLRLFTTIFVLTLTGAAVVWNVEGDRLYQVFRHTNATFYQAPDYTPLQNCTP